MLQNAPYIIFAFVLLFALYKAYRAGGAAVENKVNKEVIEQDEKDISRLQNQKDFDDKLRHDAELAERVRLITNPGKDG